MTPSGNSTLRVVCFDGVADVPAAAELGECLAMLASVQRAGELAFEPSCARHST